MLAPSGSASGRNASERRFLTIVFIDLVGYTELSGQLDPEDLGILQNRYQNLALATMERYGGFVARFVGDGILVYFGYPRAHERDAERAVLAADELLHQLGRLDTQVRGRANPTLTARVGIHSGLVVVAQELMSAGTSAPGAVGEAANLAARLQTEAPPGGILISQETLSLIEDRYECEALGARVLKGIAREVNVYRVIGAVPGSRRLPTGFQRGATRMVGREASVERILARWDRARADVRCQTLAVVADGGAGKTRLMLELCGRPELAEATILQTSCHEIFASTPLYTFGVFLRARAGLTQDDSVPVATQKVARMLDECDMNSAENRDVAHALLGVPGVENESPPAPTPQAFRRRQHDFVVAAVERLARRRPTVLWIEDTHWLDPSSAEILQGIVGALADAAVLVLLTMRSFPPGPPLPAADEVIHLEQLGDRDCLEIARSIPGAEILSAEILDQAIKAAEGVPLFLEQLVIALLDERLQGSERARRLGGVPLMLAEIMSERLDRLPGGRRIVQAAACIGRSFEPNFLLAVLDEDASRVAQPLEALVAAEILQPKRQGAEIRFEFRHSLLQQMAYESMVQVERRAMHDRIVDVLRQRTTTASMLPEVMAHHLTEAGRTREAIEAWQSAGTSAGKRSAHVEAIDHLRKGLSLLPGIDDPTQRRALELSLQVSLIGSIIATQGSTSPDLSACCKRGIELCEQGPPTPLVFPFVFGDFAYVNCRGRVEEAERLARLFISLSERSNFDSGLVIGHRMLGLALLAQGEAAKARTHLETSLRLYQPDRDAATTHMFGQNTEVHSKSLLSLTLFCQGEIDAALEMGLGAMRAADALRHPHSTALQLCYVGGWVFGLCDAADSMMLESRRLILLADQHRLADFRTHGTAFFGWALCQRGDLAQGIAAIEQAVAAFDNRKFHLALAGHLANLADAQRRLGRLAEASASSARALELMHEGSRWLEPELRRIAALVAADRQPGRQDETEALFRNAVASARELAFPVLERRCLKSLARFLGAHRRDPEVDARLDALAHLDSLGPRVESAMRGLQRNGTAPTPHGADGGNPA